MKFSYSKRVCTNNQLKWFLFGSLLKCLGQSSIICYVVKCKLYSTIIVSITTTNKTILLNYQGAKLVYLQTKPLLYKRKNCDNTNLVRYNFSFFKVFFTKISKKLFQQVAFLFLNKNIML